MFRSVVFVISVTMLVGCATKQYPIATEVSPAEAQAMSCQDIELELIRADQTRSQIADNAQIDGRSVLGFLGDFGIGNAIAKSEADEAIETRVRGLRAAQASKGC